ncbi:MAG: hypothetical protein ACRYF0_03210 [Janthinobacterium lividum]
MADDTLPGPPAGRPTELQQLEAALAAGVITPELFATLRAKLAPAAPAAAPAASRPAPAAPSEELPSLLEMFGSTPSPVVPPPSPPAAASPPRQPTTAADDAAARRRIEEHLAKLRQDEQTAKLRQAAPAAPPVVVPAPPAPTFYPAPAPVPTPAPSFYPASPPAAPTPPARPPVASSPEAPPRRPAPAPAPTASNRTWLPLLLVVLLAVVGGLAYYFTSTSHPDEELTSSQPATPEPVPAAAPKPTKPKRTKAPKRAKVKKKAAKTPVAAVEATNPDDLTEDPSPASVAAPVPAAKPAEPAAGRPIAAAAEAGDDAATAKVRDAMASYYADLYAPPLHASQHFAPQVERLYIRQNLTPEAIDAELARSFFPDNQQAVSQIEPGTLRVSSPAADGTRTATFTEVMRLYRVSLQKYQRLRTQVRVRFNSAYQIVYMRQEKLLANTFEEQQ